KTITIKSADRKYDEPIAKNHYGWSDNSSQFRRGISRAGAPVSGRKVESGDSAAKPFRAAATAGGGATAATATAAASVRRADAAVAAEPHEGIRAERQGSQVAVGRGARRG